MVPYLGIMATYKNVPPPAIALNYRGYITAWHDDSLLVGTVDRRSGFDEEPTAQSIAELQGRLETVLELNTAPTLQDRKSTRLNSSHVAISYAVFCLKKKITVK